VFSPVGVVADAAASSMIEVEFASGARIVGAADPAMVSAIIETLVRNVGRR
jgi:hypothetical protein